MAKIPFFGPLSDMLNIRALELKLSGQVKTVADLIVHLYARRAAWKRDLQADTLQSTRNRHSGAAGMAIVDSVEHAFSFCPGSI